MDITVYLPDDLGKKAKAAGLPFSQLLRSAVTKELVRMEQEELVLAKGVEEFLLPLESAEGGVYKGRLEGTLIAAGDYHQVFLTSDRRVIAYDGTRREYDVVDDPEEELRAYLSNDEYAQALWALGLEPVIDI